MAYQYIHPNFHTIRIKCIDLSNGSTYGTITLDCNVELDLKSEDKIYTNLNNEILIDRIGDRMNIKCLFINRVEINDQSDILKMIEYVNLTKNRTHILKIWPSWSESYLAYQDILDSFLCTITSPFKFKNLHSFINAGNNIEIIFTEITPNVNYIPKVPRIFEPSIGNVSGPVV